jgi:hypothetical protein
MATDQYFPVTPPLKTGPQGFILRTSDDARINVDAAGNATLIESNGVVAQRGTCHRVGGL